MRCEDFQGEALARHRATCPVCRDLEAVDELLSTWPATPPLPEDLVRQVMAAVHAPPRRRWEPAASMLLLAAAVWWYLPALDWGTSVWPWVQALGDLLPGLDPWVWLAGSPALSPTLAGVALVSTLAGLAWLHGRPGRLVLS